MKASLSAETFIDEMRRVLGPHGDCMAEFSVERVRLLAGQLGLVGGKQPALSDLQVLAERLKQWGAQPDGRREGFNLATTLDSRKGNCVEWSVLLVLLGKLVNLPLVAVRVPGHMFVRAGDGRTEVNIETMALGEFPSDAQYAATYVVTQRQAESGTFLRALSDQELLAEVAHKVVYPTLSRGERITPSNRSLLRRVFGAYPVGIEFYNSLGMNYCLRRRFRFAETILRKGRTLDSESVPLCNNLAQSLIGQGQWNEAVDLLLESIRCDPVNRARSPHLLRNLGKAYCRLGEFERALQVYADLDEVFEATHWPLEKRLCDPYVACIHFLRGDFIRSAEVAARWASLGRDNEIGWVWQASALRQIGELTKSESRPNIAVSDHVAALTRLMSGELSAEEIVARSDKRRPEIECYLGEYWIRHDPDRAVRHWRSCCERADLNTFEHLRASGSLAQICDVKSKESNGEYAY